LTADRTTRRLRLAAAAVTLATVAGFAAMAFLGRLPRSPEGNILGAAIEGPLQLGLLAVVVLGWGLSLRWAGPGAAIIALGGLGLGLLASIEYPPRLAVLVTVAFAVPAVLVWLTWQHDRTHREIVLLAIATAVMLVIEAVGTVTIYDHYFGPAHPESATAAVPIDLVEWVWAGGLEPDAVSVVARRARGVGGSSATLAVWGGGRALESSSTPFDTHRLARLRIDGLDPDTAYRYEVRVDGVADQGRGRGRFRSAPSGPASFSFAVGSCARTGSSGAVYDAIRATDPLLYLVTGDIHYANLESTDPGDHIDALGAALSAPSQAALYRSVPVDYVWDDHDYGPNDADSTSPVRFASRRSYRAAVPHAPLPAGPDGSIYHAFTIGRVRFIVTDTRSERTDTTLLGAEQEAWLLGELARAGEYGAVVWVNPDPWIAPAAAGRDDWGGYPEERRRIADALVADGVDNLVMVSGDAHMVAIDDGSNSDYSTQGGGGFPILHAAALDRPGSVKGGPYSESAFPGAGQFGLVQVEDDGRDVHLTLQGRNWTGRVLTSLTVSFPAVGGPSVMASGPAAP
jgi:hypothetical protein